MNVPHAKKANNSDEGLPTTEGHIASAIACLLVGRCRSASDYYSGTVALKKIKKELDRLDEITGEWKK